MDTRLTRPPGSFRDEGSTLDAPPVGAVGVSDPSRIAAVVATGLLDSPDDPAFERLTRLASDAVGAPVALVSLVDGERQFFMSAYGLELTETPLSHSLCRHVVDSDAPLVVEDLRAHRTLHHEPAVVELGVATYAGVPLRDHAGITIGSFGALASEPRPWTASQVETLQEFSALATSEIVLRRTAAKAMRERAALASVLSSSLDAVVGMDAEGAITEFNPAAEAMFGHVRGDVLGQQLAEVIVPPEFRSAHRGAAARSAASTGARLDQRLEVPALRADGTRFPCELTVTRTVFEGGVTFTGFLRDLSPQRDAETALAAVEHRLGLVVDAAAMILYALDENGCITLALGSGLADVGLSPGELEGQSALDLYADFPSVLANIRRALAGESFLADGEMGGVVFESRFRPILAADGRFMGTVCVSLDVTERRRQELELVRAEGELRSARDYLRAVADSIGEGMCTLDLDGRLVYMNGAAERLLGWTADQLMGKVLHDHTHHRHADGSPFPIEDCPILATRHEGKPVRIEDDCFIRRDGTTLPVEYSATPFQTPEGIRGTVLLFSDITERKEREERLQRGLEDLAWVGRINDAIEQNRLVLHAQPIVDLSSGATVQHELLIRMLDENGSPISPGMFLPVAERYGLIREIDRWVVRQAGELSAQGHSVELNISADSLGDPGFAATVERELWLAGADCSLIVVELTETALLRDEDAARAFVERVQVLGCRLALDDFGTGYGGFTYLKSFKVDYLKIDIEFVRDLLHNEASKHVVRAVVNLARGFGQKTVAEGVEDADTLDLLRQLGVDYAQGYHLGRPTPAMGVFASSTGDAA